MCLQGYKKYIDSDHPKHPCSLIRALYYLMIILHCPVTAKAWSDCMYEFADKGLCSPHMLEDSFSFKLGFHRELSKEEYLVIILGYSYFCIKILRSSWTSVQSDQSLLSAGRNFGSLAIKRVPSDDWLDWAIRLARCADWSETLLHAHVSV